MNTITEERSCRGNLIMHDIRNLSRLTLDIAAGEKLPADDTYTLQAALKDYTARNRCRAHWIRFVWRIRNGLPQWQYFGQRELLPKKRKDVVFGSVQEGEIVIQYDAGKQTPSAVFVVLKWGQLLPLCFLSEDKLMIDLQFNHRTVVLPNPQPYLFR
jgi:hypothetical protein